MSLKLRILSIEDNPHDTELIMDEFEQAGYQVEFERVSSADALNKALDKKWDLITSDHAMPSFSSRAALKIVKERGLDVPFLLVSGSVGELEAVELMRLGVNDYILKDNLSRLVVSAEREMREFENRREAEIAVEKVRSSELKFSLLFESAPYSILLVKLPEGTISDVNDEWLKVFGYTKNETIGNTTLGLAIYPDQNIRAELYEKFWKNGHVRDFVTPLLLKSGATRIFSMNMNLIEIENEKFAFATFADITEAKRLEQNLQEAIRARDEFLSIASHELKTPLTSLSLQTQIIQRAYEKGDPEAYASPRMHKLVKQSEKHVQRLNRLVEDMLDISRIQSGRFSLKTSTEDLCKILKEVIDHLKEQAQVAGCEIKFNHCTEALGQWDGFRIEQVFTNLVSNAIKYGNRKPIEVNIEETGEGYLVRFKDQGIGINVENLERIFYRYERAISASEVSGLGLGLFITKQIVEAHGGKISVESSPGKGSEFLVFLPREITYQAQEEF